MLRVEELSLYQFKNYPMRKFHFTERMIGICGSNGVGKTNLLDALYYLCFTKSYFTRTDINNVLHGAQGFRIEGSFNLDEAANTLVCILRETGKKEFLADEESYTRLADHVGRFPAVIITPDDVQIITDGSEERRRFLDALLSQLDARYLQNLIDYNRVLQQRNSFLKLLAEKRGNDTQLLDVYDAQLTEYGNYIYQVRQQYLQLLIPAILKAYAQIAGAEEDLELVYESQLHANNFGDLLVQSRERDRLTQRSNTGIHKDDLAIRLKQQPFKSIASQGQRKSLLFALKLSEFDILKENKGFAPLLLLDDVFEKLDASRMHNLLERVCKENNGQVFITDTHRERFEEHMFQLDTPYQVIDL